MRMKKTGNTRFAYRLDKVFWFFIQFIPLFSWLVYLISFTGYKSQEASVLSFGNWIANYFLGFSLEENIVFTTLLNIFGQGGVFPIFGTAMVYFFTYLIMIEIVHVVYDVIVFIPRLAHKWISKAVQDD